MFWNHTWQSAQGRALCTQNPEVNVSAFIPTNFHVYMVMLLGRFPGVDCMIMMCLFKYKCHANVSRNLL